MNLKEMKDQRFRLGKFSTVYKEKESIIMKDKKYIYKEKSIRRHQINMHKAK